MESGAPHIPVLYREVLGGLNAVADGWYIDCTIGAGGHAIGILYASAPDGRLLGLDADPNALELCRTRLSAFKNRVTLVHANFAHLKEVVDAMGWELVDGILFDLGVSSMQLATPERGFSFQSEGPLDMRFSPDVSRTAADLVNTLPEPALAHLIYRYGEEPASRAIARAIVAARPIHTTTELAHIVSQAVGRRRPKSRRHPATRTFQALRIAVNRELESLEQGLRDAVSLLKPGGRVAVITFHSLEDRIVKRFFVQEAQDCICPPQTMVCTCNHKATLELVNKKPIEPGPEEVRANPASRSAKLRIAQKL